MSWEFLVAPFEEDPTWVDSLVNWEYFQVDQIVDDDQFNGWDIAYVKS